MNPTKRGKHPKWLTVCVALASPLLGILLFIGLLRLADAFESVRLLFELLQIVAVPAALVLVGHLPRGLTFHRGNFSVNDLIEFVRFRDK